jgi:carotenoid cleavage dioxygenase
VSDNAELSVNPYLSGNFAPVTEELTAVDLPVEGTLPETLDGRYVRNGPNPRSADPATYHWFLGDGMVHGIRLRDGRAQWYRNRWVRSDDGRGGPNTNVVGFAGRTLALVEAGAAPVELTDELDTIGPTDFDGALPHGYTAHPKLDPVTGELHAAGYLWSRPNVIEYSVIGPDGRVRRREDVPVPGGPMVHDMSITERHAVLYDLPVVFDLGAAAAGASFPYVWHDDYGARVGVLPRDGEGTDDLIWFEVEPCYVFHPMNAHDAVGPGGEELVVLVVVRHERVFGPGHRGPDESTPTLWRWTLDLTNRTVRTEQLHDDPVEFPRVDERRVGRAHRYGWAASVAPSGGAGTGVVFDGATIAKFDLHAGTVQHHTMGPGRAAGEAVFVPTHATADEDDGHLLTLVHDAATDRSELVVLAAQDPSAEPVARVLLPQRVPFGFHGNWIPTA